MSGFLSRRVAKWVLLVLAVPVLFFAAWYGYLFVSAYFSPEQVALRDYFSDLTELALQEQLDTYYGETPEETLALFIAALEKGDIELASKYFEVSDRDRASGELKEINDGGYLQLAISDLKKLKFEGERDGYAFFIVSGIDNLVQIQVILRKNEKGWKMNEL